MARRRRSSLVVSRWVGRLGKKLPIPVDKRSTTHTKFGFTNRKEQHAARTRERFLSKHGRRKRFHRHPREEHPTSGSLPSPTPPRFLIRWHESETLVYYIPARAALHSNLGKKEVKLQKKLRLATSPKPVALARSSWLEARSYFCNLTSNF